MINIDGVFNVVCDLFKDTKLDLKINSNSADVSVKNENIEFKLSYKDKDNHKEKNDDRSNNSVGN
jgi:hypothetical protein